MNMTDAPFLPPPQIEYNAAKRQFVELYGSLAVMNTYLKIAVLSLCLVCLGLTYLDIKTVQDLNDSLDSVTIAPESFNF